MCVCVVPRVCHGCASQCVRVTGVCVCVRVHSTGCVTAACLTAAYVTAACVTAACVFTARGVSRLRVSRLRVSQLRVSQRRARGWPHSQQHGGVAALPAQVVAERGQETAEGGEQRGDVLGAPRLLGETPDRPVTRGCGAARPLAAVHTPRHPSQCPARPTPAGGRTSPRRPRRNLSRSPTNSDFTKGGPGISRQSQAFVRIRLTNLSGEYTYCFLKLTLGFL